MSGPAELAIWTGALLDAGLKATALLSAGLVGARLSRRSTAANRHAVWTLTLGALPLLLALARARGPEIAVDRPWLVALWAGGAAVAMSPLALGLWRLSRLRWTPTASVGRIRLGASPEIAGPLTWGWLRPVVLLSSAVAWPPDQRQAAVAHELAHVRRGDWLVHVLTWGVCALFWFHPLVWVAWRELGIEAEHAADDEAIARGATPSSLAAVLLGIAAGAAPRGALAAGSSTTSRRIRAVLDVRPRNPSRWRAAVVGALGLTLALPAVASWHPWTAPPEALTCAPIAPGLLP